MVRSKSAPPNGSALTPSPLRRIIPSGYATASLHLQGTSPLLMNSADFDRDSDLFRTFTLLSQKQRKTLDDDARLRELEWQLRINLDPEIGPFVPGRMVKGCLAAAATKWRKGTEIGRSVITVLYRIPLLYEGPRDQQGLWDAGYRYVTMVKNAGPSQGRVLRCRPMFEDWSLDAELAYDPEDLDPDMLAAIVERSQKYGIGDYRPEFGTFAATITGEAFKTARPKSSALSERNGHEEAAHEAFRSRVMAGTAAG